MTRKSEKSREMRGGLRPLHSTVWYDNYVSQITKHMHPLKVKWLYFSHLTG